MTASPSAAPQPQSGQRSSKDVLSPVRIVVDCMGGDHGPSVTLPASKSFLDKHPEAELVLVGLPEAIEPARNWPRTTLVPASEVVTMDDPVEVALRRKKDSSMRVAISQLKATADKPALGHACVSAGNTGALMGLARYLLKTVEGIDRPALATVMPNQKDGYTTVLDLGANVDCTAEHLLQFAVMGPVLACSTSAKKSSRAAKSSNKRVACCARPTSVACSTSTATLKATIFSRARPISWCAMDLLATWL
jgi:glycerol-3-phosphate acyltransferase PlsX